MPPVRPYVLIIRRRYLGDIALLGAVFRNLRQYWPESRLAALVEAPYAPVLAMNAEVNETWTLPQRAAEWLPFLWRLRRAGFTHVLDFDNTDKTALLTRTTGAPLRAMLVLENVPTHFPGFYTHRVFVSSKVYSSRSIAETYLGLLRACGVTIYTTDEFRLVPPEADREKVRSLFPAHGPRILLHPGSRSAFRLWPAENFAAVCQALRRESGVSVIIAGGPADQKQLDEIRARVAGDISFAPADLTVSEFAALASACDVVLCHDSGPMHIAAAVGTPVVALFGSQSAVIWRPLGRRHVIIQPPLPCTACVAPDKCNRDDSYRNFCVRRITVDEVLVAVRSQLHRVAAAES